MNKDLGFIKVEGKLVVKVEVKGHDFGVQWGDSWAPWELLQKSSELQAFLIKARGNLEKHKARTSKGTGKGPLA